jgi:outer membrane receptor protein involved in Fe transport
MKPTTGNRRPATGVRRRPFSVAGCLLPVAGCLLLGRTALADDKPHLPVIDLPPLPQVEAEDRVAGVVVAAGEEAEEMRVTGAAKREQSLGTVASAVTVIAGDRLRRFGYRKLSEALRSAAGVFVVDDRMSERIGFRGLQLLGDFNTRALVLVDGLTLTEPWNQFTGIADDLPVSIDEVARVEVIRGPVSSVYGTNAFFGIINIITRPADQSPHAWGRVTAGSFGTAGAAAGFAAGTVDQEIRGTVSGTYRAGDTVNYPEFAASGADPATDADGMQAGQLGLVARYHGAFAQVRAYRRLRQLPGAPYDTVIGDHRNHNTDRHMLVEAGYTRSLQERLTATARGYFNDYRFSDFLVYEPDPNFRDYGDSQWYGAELRGRYDLLPRGQLGLTGGMEAAHNSTLSRSYEIGFIEDGVRVPRRFDVEGVYGELDGTPTEWLGFAAGLRFDRNSKFGTHLSPRAALFFDQQDRYGLKLLYADGFRYPSPLEAFFEDGIDFIANPDLSPERIRSYEVVAWSVPRPATLLRASAFRWNLADLIEQNVVDIGGGETRLQFQNIAQMTSTGVELEASVRTTNGWLLFAAASAQQVEREGGAEIAANAPRLVASAGASTPLLRRRVHLSTELVGLSRRRLRDGTSADPWVGWNLCAYVPDYRGLDLTVGIRNTLGIREQVPAQEDYDRTDGIAGDNPIYSIPGEGRELYARLGYKY